MKKNSILGIIIGIFVLAQMQVHASTTWNELKTEADTASESSTINITSGLTADGSSIGFLQKQLTLNFNGNVINGTTYPDDSPLVFSASGSSETRLQIMNATFQGFDTENGIVRGTNPLIELTDVSFLNNKGVAINNDGYNKLIINAENNDITFKNNTDYGIKSNSSIYLNANSGKTITFDDAIKIDNNFDGNLIINNTLKANKDLNGTVILNKNVDFASSNGMIYLGAKSDYKNGTLKLGVTPANSNDFRLSVGGEATLDMQNDNVDNLTMSKFSGADDAPLHLKLDYDASTGKMDLIVVSDSAVGSSTPSIIVDAINVLVDGDATETEFLNGLGRTVIEVSSDTISAVKDKVTYIFKPKTAKSERGAFTVSKASNITDLPDFIQTEPDGSTSNDVAITEDITLTEDLGTLAGSGRDVTVYGNGHYIDASGTYKGVTVENRQTFGFNNVTLKNFTAGNGVVDNAYGGETYLTSVILDNSNITNAGRIEFTGTNELQKGLIDSTDTNAVFEIRQGTTTVGKDFTINSRNFNFGGSGTALSVATINNYGTINSQYANFNYTNINNYGTLMLDSVQDLAVSSTNIVNNGEMFSSFLSLANNSKFTNNNKFTGVVKSGGEIINNGIIDGDVKLGFTLLGNIYGGTLTSSIDSITGGIQLIDGTNSIFNITGGTVKSTDTGKIYGNGIINIVGDVISEAILDYNGKAYVKNGGELIVKTDISTYSNIFKKGELNFEDGSTLNLIHSKHNDRSDNTTIVLDENSTLNLKLPENLTLYVFKKIAQGKFNIKELSISKDSETWKPLENSDSSVYSQVSLDKDLKLTKTGNASGVNYVQFNKQYGDLTYGTKNLKEAIEAVTDGNDHFYEMLADESSDPSNYVDNGRLIVQGNNKTIHEINNIAIGGNSTSGTLVLTNANIKNVTFAPDDNGQLVIRNNSNQAINLDNTTIKNSSRVGGVTFEGTNDINFNGEYIGSSASATAKVDLGSATLTRNSNDTHAFWVLNSGTLKYANDSYLANGGMNAITFNGGNLDLRNGVASSIPLYGLALNTNSNIYVDVDLANQTMDNLSASNTNYNGGTLNVAGMTLLSDAINDFTSINFTSNDNLKSHIAYTGASQIVYSPIYKYNVAYNENNGNFEFTRGSGGGGGNGGNASEAFNPAVLAGAVGAQIGSYLTQLNTYEQAFANQDMLMAMTRDERTSMKFANKYASTQGTGEGGVVTFDPNQIPEQTKGAWFRPYATFEGVSLNNGPSVRNIGYGSLFGGDTGIIELSHGWDAVYSVYAGYNGSNQNYSGVSINQNGGTLGVSGTWYKGNFFTGLTANVGANVAEAHTMYGSEDFTMLATGIASKTGYNFELADGKFIIQPNYLMSYTFVNTFDYTNAAGVRIDSNPLHAIQIAPGLKFIGNLKNGWQPYVSLQMVWNIMDRTRFHANNVSLPDMSVDPYFQYGIGLQKRVGNRFTGFGQAMVRNGGRNGIALSFGFRWALGK